MIADPEVRREFVKLGLVPVQSPPPEALPGFVRSEIALLGRDREKGGARGHAIGAVLGSFPGRVLPGRQRPF